MERFDWAFPWFCRKSHDAKCYTQVNVRSFSDLDITFFLIVKIIQSHVGNSDSTEENKNHQKLLSLKVLVTIQPEGCLSSLNSCWIRVRAELFIETVYGLKLYLALVFYHYQAAQTVYK